MAIEKIKEQENALELADQVDIYVDKLTNVIDISRNMLGFLIVVPEDPENEHLSLYNGFLKILLNLKRSEFPVVLSYIRLYTEMLKYLACQLQDKLPYHIKGVRSNDELYRTKEFKI